MEEEDDEDIYAPNDVVEIQGQSDLPIVKVEKKGEDLEEGEEEGEELEEDGSDSDIDIITEQKEETKIEPPHAQRVSTVKKSPLHTLSSEPITRSQSSPAVKNESSIKTTPSRSGASYPAIKISKIDVDARPIYEPNGKPITEIDMDADFPEDDKPWRRPGTDLTDYFNYGFDEFTWASYCLKQDLVRKEVTDSKKQMEEMQSFLGMPGITAIPSMAGQAGTAQPNIANMGGPGDVPPEMQQMMAQMMAQGLDPTQMDPAVFMQQMMQGTQTATNGAQGQNFGGAQAFGQGQSSQQMGFGYSGGSGGGSNRNQGGRGQNRRNW